MASVASGRGVRDTFVGAIVASVASVRGGRRTLGPSTGAGASVSAVPTGRRTTRCFVAALESKAHHRRTCEAPTMTPCAGSGATRPLLVRLTRRRCFFVCMAIVLFPASPCRATNAYAAFMIITAAASSLTLAMLLWSTCALPPRALVCEIRGSHHATWPHDKREEGLLRVSRSEKPSSRDSSRQTVPRSLSQCLPCPTA